MEGKIKHTIVLPPETSIFLRVIAARTRRDKSDVVELALKILGAIVKAGYIPDDLGAILSEEVAGQLRDLLDAVKATAEVVA